MRKESLEFLRQLLNAPTPSGYESPGQKLWCDYARAFADDVTTDAYGNAVAVLNPGGDPKIMLEGHVDEIGMMVKFIDDKGYLYVQRIGGVDPAMVRGKRVNVQTEHGVLRGVIGAPAIHLQDRDKDAKAPKIHESYVDLGLPGEQVKKKVRVGDVITFVDDFELLHEHVGVARGFDNRAGVWVAIEALRLAAEAGKLACCLCACSSVQEEVGLQGAKMVVHNVKPDAAVCIDVTHATDTPGIDPKQHGDVKLGKGPTVAFGRENHPALVERLRKVARAKRIALQLEAFTLSGGTDTMVVYTAGGGVPSALVSVPTRYMHTTVEMIDLRDLQRAAELLAAFCGSLKKGERFAVTL